MAKLDPSHHPGTDGRSVHARAGGSCLQCRWVGSIGIGTSSLAMAWRMVEEARAQTSGLFKVNVLSDVPEQRDAAREAAWLAHLSPFFEEFGAVPPVEPKEI